MRSIILDMSDVKNLRESCSRRSTRLGMLAQYNALILVSFWAHVNIVHHIVSYHVRLVRGVDGAECRLEMCMGMVFPFPWDSHGNPMGMGKRICQKWEWEWEEYT